MNPFAPLLACDLTKLTGAERQRLETVVANLFSSADEVHGLPNGYSIAYVDASAKTISEIGEFIAFDRLCCAFLTHELVSEPFGGATWLKITGGDGAKEVIAADVKRLVSPSVVIVGNL